MTTFARVVFALAGVMGCIALIVRYLQVGSYSEYSYNAILLAWQIAFLVIAVDPVRYRLVMVPAILEKGIYVATVLLLAAAGGISEQEPVVRNVVAHGGFGVLFLAAFFLTSRARSVA